MDKQLLLVHALKCFSIDAEYIIYLPTLFIFRISHNMLLYLQAFFTLFLLNLKINIALEKLAFGALPR